MPGQGSQQSAGAGLNTDPTDSCQRWVIGPLLGHTGTCVKDGPYLLELPLMSQIGHVRAATYNGTLVIDIGEGKHITYTGNLER